MNLASKIILGFLIVVALVFFYLAMYAQDLHGWQRAAQTMKTNLERTNAENALLRNSDDANASDALIQLASTPTEREGRKQLRGDLSRIVVDRGRMWLGNAVPAANAPGAPLIFTIQADPAKPTPLSMEPKMSLFVFEYPPVAGDAANNAPPGRFLGEFTVLDAPPIDPAGGKFAMTPARSMSTREQTRLTEAIQSGMPWIAYENLPHDQYGVFEGMTAEQLETQFPGVFTAEQKAELELDGQPFESGKHPADRQDASGKYRRPLTDFGHALQTMYRVRSLLTAEIAAWQKDLEYMKFANEDVQKQIAYRQDEIKLLQEELARTEAETKLVQDQLQAVEAKLATVRATADRIEQDNRRLVAQLAGKQRQALTALETAQASP
ncbi:MAG: hypothetical protein SGJ19_11660 [Planctomycetia bacterium]|nr:hypothetical protein [Planctomycetia bacterium]